MNECMNKVMNICINCNHIHTYIYTQPENILLYRKGSLDIKIADFGLSVQVKEGQEMKTLVGTAEYVCKLERGREEKERDKGGGERENCSLK